MRRGDPEMFRSLDGPAKITEIYLGEKRPKGATYVVLAIIPCGIDGKDAEVAIRSNLPTHDHLIAALGKIALALDKYRKKPRA